MVMSPLVQKGDLQVNIFITTVTVDMVLLAIIQGDVSMVVIGVEVVLFV